MIKANSSAVASMCLGAVVTLRVSNRMIHTGGNALSVSDGMKMFVRDL